MRPDKMMVSREQMALWKEWLAGQEETMRQHCTGLLWRSYYDPNQ